MLRFKGHCFWQLAQTDFGQNMLLKSHIMADITAAAMITQAKSSCHAIFLLHK